nr:PTS system protein [Raoultella sp. NCTC 9187]
MTVIYQTTITHIGASATMALEEQMLITFREGAPADIEEYCFIHNHGELVGALAPGAELQLGIAATRSPRSATWRNRICASWAISRCASTATAWRSFRGRFTWPARYRRRSPPAVY